jgi:hypothetical protein
MRFSVLRTLGHTPGSVSAPAAPTLAMADDGSGSTATATVAGAAGSTHQVYRWDTTTGWTLAGSRLGDGTISLTGLASGQRVTAVAVSVLAGCNSLPSDLAWATITDGSAPLAEFRFTNSDPDEAELETAFGRLLYRTCETINELALFKAVMPFIRTQAVWQSPTCIVAPDSDMEEQATNRGVAVRYRFKIGFVVAGQDGSKLALQCLALRGAVKRAFRQAASGNKLIFTDVVGHHDTNVVESFPSPVREMEGGALYYNAGLTVEYLVREMRVPIT